MQQDSKKQGPPFIDTVVQSIQIEKGFRSFLDSLVIYSHYMADYLILWIMLSESVKTYKTPLLTFVAFFGVRLALAFLFIICRHPVFLMANKLMIFVQMLISSGNPFYFSIATVVLELVMCGIWVLTKDQRKQHCDSSLGIGKLFLKQVIIYGLLAISSVYTELQWTVEKQYVVGIATVLILGVDWTHFYYHSRVKFLFIKLDLSLLALFLLLVFKERVGITYPLLILSSAVLFVFVFVEFVIMKKSFRALLEGNLVDVDTCNEEDIAEHFINVKLLSQSRERVMIDSFVHKIMQEAKLTIKNYHLEPQNALDQAYKEDLINAYIIESLKNHSRYSTFLRDLLIFLYSPDPRVFVSFDLNCWKHRREYQRILTSQNQMAMLQEFEFEKQKKQARHLLKKCVNLRHQFYRELTQEKIKQGKTLQLGLQLMEVMRMYMNNGEAAIRNSPQTTFLFNKFSSRCLSPYFEFKIPMPENYQHEKSQKNPQLLVGVRFQRYMKLLSMNNQLKQIGSYNSKQMKNLSIQSIFGIQFEKIIRNIIEQESHKRQRAFKNVEKKLDLVLLKSSLDFTIVCQCSIISSHLNWDYCLKIDLKPLYFAKPIIVIDSTGKILGLSNLARHFGFSAEHINKTIFEHVLRDLLQKQEHQTSKGESITKAMKEESDYEIFKLTVLARVKPAHLPKQVIVLELKFHRNQMVAIDDVEHAESVVPFEFNFNWSGRIINFYTQNQLPVAQDETVRKADAVYDTNITEMRYFNEKVDYKVNFDEEQDCPPLPVQVEEEFPVIEDDQFFTKIEMKKGSRPLSLKAVYVLVILLILLSLGTLTYLLLTFNTESQNNTQYLSILLKLQAKLHLLISMTAQPLIGSLIGFDPQTMIQKAIVRSGAISTELFSMNVSLMSSSAGQRYQSGINQFTAKINQYLLNPTPANAQIVFTTYTKLGGLHSMFRGEKLKEWNQKMQNFEQNSSTVIIVPTILGFIMLFLISAIHYRLYRNKKNIMDVLKSLDNDELQEQVRQLQIFKSQQLQNEDSHGNQEKCQQQQQHWNSPKKVVQCGAPLVPQVCHLVWLLLVILAVVLLCVYIKGFNTSSARYLDFATNLSGTFTMQNAAWLRLHITPFNFFVYRMLTMFRMTSENSTFVAYRQLIQDPYVGIENFYEPYWQNATFCDYFKNEDCLTILGTAINEGGSLVFNYLSSSYEDLKDLMLKRKQSSTHPNYKTIVKLYYIYLYQMLFQNHQAIQGDFALFTSKYWTQIGIIFALGVAVTLSLVGFIFYYRRVWKEHELHEDLLLTIPFQKLRQIPAFHRFYQEQYKDL